MKKPALMIMILLLITIGVAVWLYVRRVQPMTVAMSTPKNPVVKINTVTIPVEIVDTPMTQERGLADRDSLPQEAGMLFVFPNAQMRSFWMKGMRFPLDIIWIRSGVVIDITANAPVIAADAAKDAPLPTYAPKEPIDSVLEVNAGFAAKHGITVGNHVTIGANGFIATASAIP